MSCNWIDATLGDYIDFKNGKNSPERNDGDPFSVFGSNGVIGYTRNTNAPENTLIVGRVGSYCGSVYHSYQKCWVTDNAIIGLPKNSGESEFWYFLLQKLDLNSFRSGSGQPLLNQATLNSIPIKIPDDSEVRSNIGKKLMLFSEKIHLNTQTNQTLEQIAQAIFKSWFVDFDPVKAKIAALEAGGTQDAAELAAMSVISGKDEAQLAQLKTQDLDAYQQLAQTAALFPAAMQESELGEIPEGWEVKLSGEIMDIRDGTHDSPKQSETGFPLITSKHIVSGVLAINDAYLISADDFEKINKRSKVSTGDILLTMIGTVGTPYLVMQKNTDFAIKNIGLFKTSSAKTLRNYFFFLLKSVGMQDYLEARMIGTTQKYLSLKTLRSIESLVPSEAILAAFNKITDPIMQGIIGSTDQSENLSNFRDSLLPKLLSGEIDLSDIQIEVA